MDNKTKIRIAIVIALGTALYVFVPKIIGIVKDILARLAT